MLDVKESRAAGYPLFSADVTMVSGENRAVLERTGVEVHIAGTPRRTRRLDLRRRQRRPAHSRR
ncbi:hypothetical protein ABT116_37010 [Streptomyces sp. NPDC002130]|uniref:hypothetical protein n=1 Tax=Streptomyces sp. NPDC002130 TaxID=3155568 RepID=UPI003323B2BB